MKKTILMSLILGAILSTTTVAHAADSSSSDSSTTTTAKPADSNKNSDGSIKDIDEEITNARLRSTLGSKSRWSVKSALSYTGSSVQRPFAEIRPNYQEAATIPALTSLAGSVGINYRISAADSLAFGAAVAMMDPLHGNLGYAEFQDPRKNYSYKVDRYQISTPYLDYSRGYKTAGMQMVTDVQYSQFTDADSINEAKAFGSLALTQTVLADFGKSNWSAGLQFAVSVNFFTGSPSAFYVSEGGRQDDVDYGIYPFAEYTFNDTFSFRTVFGYFSFEHFNDHQDAAGSVEALTPYQSIGVGISVTRDIYLYPNVQFIPLDIRGDRTNVALSANINVF